MNLPRATARSGWACAAAPELRRLGVVPTGSRPPRESGYSAAPSRHTREPAVPSGECSLSRIAIAARSDDVPPRLVPVLVQSATPAGRRQRGPNRDPVCHLHAASLATAAMGGQQEHQTAAEIAYLHDLCAEFAEGAHPLDDDPSQLLATMTGTARRLELPRRDRAARRTRSRRCVCCRARPIALQLRASPTSPSAVSRRERSVCVMTEGHEAPAVTTRHARVTMLSRGAVRRRMIS